jgi:hypothetical protein
MSKQHRPMAAAAGHRVEVEVQMSSRVRSLWLVTTLAAAFLVAGPASSEQGKSIARPPDGSSRIIQKGGDALAGDEAGTLKGVRATPKPGAPKARPGSGSRLMEEEGIFYFIRKPAGRDQPKGR